MKRVVLLFLLVLSLHAAERPALIVVISVDQLRYDLVDRYAPWFTSRGFRRLASEGATFPNARYRYATAFTGPGHAAIGTGRIPAENGIVGNTWFEADAPVNVRMWDWYFDDITAYRPAGAKATPFTADGEQWWKESGSPRYCVFDDRVQPTAGKTYGMSPATLAEDSLGDRIKERFPHARVISVALKDRAAILMGGRRADAAYWFDRDLPGFISSTYYHVDEKVFAFNDLLDGYFPASREWRLSGLIPRDELQRATFDPPEAWPLKNTTYGGTFPHPMANMKALTYTPMAHRMLLDFAEHVIVEEKLGTSDATDLLYVGISSTDYLGHYYGPDSMEVADSMVRLDRALGDFLDALERRFGNRVVVALTADHGVQANPEIVKLRDPHADTGRLDIRTPDARARTIADLPPMRIAIERALAKKLGVAFDEDAPLANALVYFFEEPALWIHWKRIRELGLEPERVKIALRDVLLAMKDHGIGEVWTNTELLQPNPHASRAEQLMRNAYRSDRSGDVLIALRPGWIWMWGTNSTSHGQPVENDLHVPLLLWGAGIKPGRYEGPSSPLDLAPTLGALAGVEAGGRESHMLPCIEGLEMRD